MINFKRLIKKYSKTPAYQLIETEGGRDPSQGGIYVPGKVEEVLLEDAAVLPLNKDELQYDEGGTYTRNDRKLYCYAELKQGSKVRHKDKDYTIQEKADYSDFANGLYIYFIKRGGQD